MSFSASPTESFDVIVVGGGEAHEFIIRSQRQRSWSGEKLGLNSKYSLQTDVVESDLGVVIDIDQDEIAVTFSRFKGEFVFTQ